MSEILDQVYALFPFVVRLLLAAVMGGILGWEPERRDRPAGLRTFSLVAFGSALFAILSSEAFPDADPARIAANILSGIGFIGAGAVLREQGGNGESPETQVKGLNAAAGIWATAGVGMAAGAGLIPLAIAATIVGFVLLVFVRRLKKAVGED